VGLVARQAQNAIFISAVKIKIIVSRGKMHFSAIQVPKAAAIFV
jgi:hypothetical protein